MDLLGEPSGSVARPLTLVRVDGEQLDVALTAADQEVLDGELLRIVRADDAPPPPEVADVTDVLGESLRDRAGLWCPGPARSPGPSRSGCWAWPWPRCCRWARCRWPSPSPR